MAAEGKDGIARIFERVLRDFRPTYNEVKAAESVSNDLMLRLKKALPRNVEIILAGSVARGTQISGNSDIDIFLLFPREMKKEEMEKEGMKVARGVIDRKRGESAVIKYAEHPYLQLISKKPPIKADIVPAFKIRDSFERGSSVDRTQLHNDFVLKHLSTRQKDDVRLLKVLMKFHNVYGAEAERGGFSGYLCELLVHHYGSFSAVLEAFARLRPPLCINAKERKTISDALLFRRFCSDFVVIDPTDKDRNVAAAVSKSALARFVLVSRMFLQNPTIKFFYGVEYSDERSTAKLKKIAAGMGTDAYFATFKVPDIARDIIFQQLAKFTTRLGERLAKSHFEPVLSLYNAEGTAAVAAFFINKGSAASVVKAGPEVFLKDAPNAFIKAHRLTFIRDYRLVSVDKAAYRTPMGLFRDELRAGLPSYLRGAAIRVNMVPEKHAKLIYRKYMEATNI